jgi:hypothetical protein
MSLKLRDGWQGLNLDNLITVRVQVPLSKCRSNRITPTVATGSQSVKRGEKASSWQPHPVAAEHESMDSESKGVSELSSLQPSQIRLSGWSQKAKDKGRASTTVTRKHSQ